METCEQVVRVVGQTRLVGRGLGQIRWPNTLVCILGLVHGHVWCPDSVTDDALAVVPFLEVVTSVLLMSGMDLGEENHLFHELILLETLVYKQVVALVHSSVAVLARSTENLETSAESAKKLGG